MMERKELRLECLRLAVGKTIDHQEALLRAEQFVSFVEEQDSKALVKEPMPGKAKPGNARNKSITDLE